MATLASGLQRPEVEEASREWASLLLEHSRADAASPLEPSWWDERLLHWTMRDPQVKVQLFRFMDVLPMLRDPKMLVDCLREYLAPVAERLPLPRWLLAKSARRPAWLDQRAADLVQWGARRQAGRFISGSTPAEALHSVQRQRQLRRAFTLDVLGEAVTSQSEAERYLSAYMELLDGLPPLTAKWAFDPLLDRADGEVLPRVNLSIKLSALDPNFDPVDPEAVWKRIAPRLRSLLRKARDRGAFIHCDMETYATRDLTQETFCRVLMEPEFRDMRDVGIVVQCYLRDSLRQLEQLRAWAERRGSPLWIRLVKGAYWDYETVLARQKGWPQPVFAEKWRTDAHYERCTDYLLQSHPHLRAAFGSHNLRSIGHALAAADALHLPTDAYEIQMLYGMADAEKQVFVDHQRRVRVYMPYGELIPGMAYLVRRLLENTANDSFLKAGFVDDDAAEKLAMNPNRDDDEADLDSAHAVRGLGPMAHAAPPTRPEPEFRNEPPADFSKEDVRKKMSAALVRVRGKLGAEVALGIGGVDRKGATRTASVNCSKRSEILGYAPEAEAADVEAAVAGAHAALPGWGRTPVAQRAALLRKVAAAMRREHFDLAAWIVLESGKPWREADADVGEAIDFLEYYALAAEELERRRGVRIPGEDNRFVYLPRGVTAVIAPWNFPLAILTGMTSAAISVGNPVVMKPAEQTPLVARRLYDLFMECGTPPGVLSYLPGRGEVVGAALVEHSKVAMIVFTGSREVGLSIHAAAAEASRRSGVPFVKKVVAEMGGKNAIIVDELADLDEAVLGVLHAAFGYQGQKCSACSRAIVLESVYDLFVERLAAAAKALPVGPAEEPSTVVGPLIDPESLTRVRRAIQTGREEAREVLSVSTAELAEQGCFVGPHIFADVPPKASLARDEFFGPVLAIVKARDFDHAIQIANDVDYALTGAVYSRNPARLEQAAREFLVGNLYLNRSSTGAMVGRQPFGGFKLSGIGSQAGGPDYLLQFVLPRTITENTMRRGFAPDEEG